MAVEWLEGEFLGSDGEYLEARIRLNGLEYVVFDDFGGDSLGPGTVIRFLFAVSLFGDQGRSSSFLSELNRWSTLTSANPKARAALVHIDGWRYRAYGVVCGVDPVVVDCGGIELEAPINSRDARLIGTPVSFLVGRLECKDVSVVS